MRKKDARATRQLILDSAENKFSEKGFDGASISEIAKDAGVNVALIYYYFENKKAILNELLDRFVSVANSYLAEIVEKKYSYDSPDTERLMNSYNEYLVSHSKTLRLLLTESLKSSCTIPPIFKLIHSNGEMNEEKIFCELNERGFNFDTDSNQRKVTEFFTGIMPIVILSLFKEDWCRYFKIEPQQLMDYFNTAIDITHNQHHLSNKNQ